MIPLDFQLHPSVVSGRDEIILLLPRCPADPARQETRALLWGSLPVTGAGKGDVPHSWVPLLLSCSVRSCQILPQATVPCGVELCALSPVVHTLKPQEKQGKMHTESHANPTKAVWSLLLTSLCATCGCCDSCMPSSLSWDTSTVL